MKATVKQKSGHGTRLKSLKENRRDVTKAATAAVKAASKPKSGKSNTMKAVKVVATGAAIVAAMAGGKALYDAGQNAMKPAMKSKTRTPKRSAAKRK